MESSTTIYTRADIWKTFKIWPISSHYETVDSRGEWKCAQMPGTTLVNKLTTLLASDWFIPSQLYLKVEENWQ